MTNTEASVSNPKHDGGVFLPGDVQVVATWPAPTFLENIAIDTAGKIFISVYSHNRIDRYDPATGLTTAFAALPAPPMGLAFDAQGVLWATGGKFPEGPGFVWKIAADGSVQHWTDLPDSPFINGCTLHPDGHTLLACESLTGRILAIELREAERWGAWLTDDLLKPNHVYYPGANGIKIKDGWTWISVSGRGFMVRTKLQPDGQPGPLETVERNISGDDFAFGASGSLYITTHVEQTVVHLDKAGVRTTIAGPEQGAAGTTACAFGRTPEDESALYVTTDGGFIVPYENQIQEAKLLRIEVGETGYLLS